MLCLHVNKHTDTHCIFVIINVTAVTSVLPVSEDWSLRVSALAVVYSHNLVHSPVYKNTVYAKQCLLNIMQYRSY